jgi:hypothetical protein
VKIRNAVIAGVIAASGATAAPVLFAGSASAATCTTTHTYTHKVTSTGSQSWEWVTRSACGKAYQRWEKLVSHSSTGSHYIEFVYRNEPKPPHYWQQTVKQSWTKKGVETTSVVIKTA